MTHQIPQIKHRTFLNKVEISWRLRVLALGIGVSALALWAVVQIPASDTNSPSDGVVAQVVPTAVIPLDDSFVSLFEGREAIPGAASRTAPLFGAPTSPGDEVDTAAITVEIAPNSESESGVVIPLGALHPTPWWVNVFSPESTLDGRPLAVGDIVTAFDERGVLIGRAEVEVEGKYGLMAMYMDDPSTSIDEGADPGVVVSFRVNGIVARVLGPHEPIWSSNGDVVMLNLAATS